MSRKEAYMKRIAVILLTVALLCLSLTGCGNEAGTANYNVNDIASSVESVAKIENPIDITEDDLVYEFGMAMENVSEFSGQKTGVANAAGTVLVVKAVSGKTDDVKNALESYKNGLVSVSENYQNDFPEAYKQISDGRVVTKGDCVILAIAAADVEYTDIDTCIDEAFK